MSEYTLDPYEGWSTPGIGDSTVNNQSADWSADAALPGAGSWSDVLKFGFGRLVDAKVRPVTPENAAPVLQKTAPASPGSGAPANATGSNKMVLAIVGTIVAAGVLYFVVKAVR